MTIDEIIAQGKITNEDEYENALSFISEYMNRDEEADSTMIKLLDIVEKYEEENYPFDPPTEEQMRDFLIDQGILVLEEEE